MTKGSTKHNFGEELKLEISNDSSSNTKYDVVFDKVSTQLDDEWNSFFISLQKDTKNKTHYLH